MEAKSVISVTNECGPVYLRRRVPQGISADWEWSMIPCHGDD
jgi:hypothetical protein